MLSIGIFLVCNRYDKYYKNNTSLTKINKQNYLSDEHRTLPQIIDNLIVQRVALLATDCNHLAPELTLLGIKFESRLYGHGWIAWRYAIQGRDNNCYRLQILKYNLLRKQNFTCSSDQHESCD